MSQLDPSNTTVSDICTAALQDGGMLGVGQTALAAELSDAQARLQWLLQTWNRKRWLVYHLVTLLKVSNGAMNYTVGPGGDFDTGPLTMRPDKLESAFLRQITQSQPNQIDYPLELVQSYEDYNVIALKQLTSFPRFIFLDPGHPLGTIYCYPVAQNALYSIGITIKAPLPASFVSSASVFSIPYEYFNAMVKNLAVALKPKYGMIMSPGDPLAAQAKEGLQVLRGANTAIARLRVPPGLGRVGIYNIFSDQNY